MALAKMALQGEAMALTDTALRELHREAKRGEKVPMKSDGIRQGRATVAIRAVFRAHREILYSLIT